MTGYFVFPPSLSDANTAPQFAQRTPFSSIQGPWTESSKIDVDADMEAAKEKKRMEEELTRKRVEREERRRRRLEHEQRQVWLSELEWVRSGGILRDKHGRRDRARTEKMREEIKLQNEERRIMDQWNAYEARWRALQAAASSDASIAWRDIPWPVHEPPSSPTDLTPDAIAEFLFAPFKVRGSTGSKKDRIRAFFLRWHPDKFPSMVLTRISSDDERDMVADGVKSVFMGLKLIQDVEKRGM